jgi:hypothetical protein
VALFEEFLPAAADAGQIRPNFQTRVIADVVLQA